MPHANAPLTELGRLRLARCVVDDGWPLRRAAERFQVAVTTAKRWADRYAAPAPPGWRTQGRAQGKLNLTATPGHATDKFGGARLGYAYLHTALDDHSRLAHTEILTDETKETATGFWRRAHAWFNAQGITISRVLTDNGSCYKSRLWSDTCTQLGVTVKKTRPYRPQTNGKVERFHRTLADEWAYAKPYTSENARRKALPAFLHTRNHHRHHTAIGGPPASRVPNLSGQNT
ncbi:DDE-type integrase/transposase/recombinase [Actinoplanes sp. NPDC000266]